MKKLIILLFITIQIFISCRTNQAEKPAGSSAKDTVIVSVVSNKLPPPVQTAPKTTFKPNVTFVGAVIEEIYVIDEFQFQLKVLLNTAIPDRGMETLIEPGQKLELSPEYFLSNNGEIDLNDERNKKIYQLRTILPGDAFMGNVSLTASGKWVITSVEDIMTNK